MPLWTVVTTHPGYVQELEQFLKSFHEVNNLIIVFQGAEFDNIDRPSQNIFRVFMKVNQYEYGAWTAVQRMRDAGIVLDCDRFLMVHDTCRFTADTVPTVEGLEGDVVWAHTNGCHNICVTSCAAVKPVADFLVQKPFMTKQEALGLESTLHNLTKNFKNIFCETGSMFLSDMHRSDRLCVFLPSFKLYKYFRP